jgi:hypothetical protein
LKGTAGRTRKITSSAFFPRQKVVPKDFGNKISQVVAALATTVMVTKDFDRLGVHVREPRKD